MSLTVRYLGEQPYQDTWQSMQSFTQARDEHTDDELWIVEHPPVFTQGLNGKAEHILVNQTAIPIVQTDRGGQITYHGPGQLIIYVLFDLKRAKLGVRALVSIIENAIIDFLNDYQIPSEARADAPGVYVNQQKIASLGLKIKKQRSYHGLALNLDMDLQPFHAINPCGLQGMQMTQLAAHVPKQQRPTLEQAGQQLAEKLQAALNG